MSLLVIFFIQYFSDIDRIYNLTWPWIHLDVTDCGLTILSQLMLKRQLCWHLNRLINISSVFSPHNKLILLIWISSIRWHDNCVYKLTQILDVSFSMPNARRYIPNKVTRAQTLVTSINLKYYSEVDTTLCWILLRNY